MARKHEPGFRLRRKIIWDFMIRRLSIIGLARKYGIKAVGIENIIRQAEKNGLVVP